MMAAMPSSRPDKLSTPQKLNYHAELLSNRVAKRFAQIDQNRDGQLSTNELQQYRQGMKEKHRF